jgi:hypothetical protein
VRHPVKYLLHRWNWKSAVLSSLLRASLFFATNLAAGLPAAIAAMKTELVFRGVTSGFYGALTEARQLPSLILWMRSGWSVAATSC